MYKRQELYCLVSYPSLRDGLIAEALQTLTEKKRNVVLLSYFMDMSDADVAREMNLVRSTIKDVYKRQVGGYPMQAQCNP